MIEIDFDNVVKADMMNVFLDGVQANISMSGQKIILNDNMDLGCHILRLESNTPERIEIKNISVNGSSLRQTLYFGYMLQEGKKIQPATVFYDRNIVIEIPFMNPVSTWISVLNQKMFPGELGANLHEKYSIYFPERAEVNSIPIVRDFFRYDFDFTMLPKHGVTAENAPYELYDIDTPVELYQEIYDTLDLLKCSNAQTQYNRVDDKEFNTDMHWFTMNLVRKGQTVFDMSKLPKTNEFLNSLPMYKDAVAISVTPPGGYSAPHIDRRPADAPKEFVGCKQLYLPLNYPDGALVKMQGVGILPNAPVVFNPQSYTHSVVNSSAHYRIVLSIIFDYRSNSWL